MLALSLGRAMLDPEPSGSVASGRQSWRMAWGTPAHRKGSLPRQKCSPPYPSRGSREGDAARRPYGVRRLDAALAPREALCLFPLPALPAPKAASPFV